MLLNCGVGEDSWESLGLQGDPQSILKEISPGYSLEGLMLMLKLQYFGHLMWKTDSFEKSLMLGKIEGRRRRGQQGMRWLDGTTDSMDMSLSKLQGDGQRGLACCSSWDHKDSDMTEQLNWTELNMHAPTFRSVLQHSKLSSSILYGIHSWMDPAHRPLLL